MGTAPARRVRYRLLPATRRASRRTLICRARAADRRGKPLTATAGCRLPHPALPPRDLRAQAPKEPPRRNSLDLATLLQRRYGHGVLLLPPRPVRFRNAAQRAAGSTLVLHG